MGSGSIASSYDEVVMGRYNALYDQHQRASWVSTDPLFEIGIGTTTTSTADAVVVYKDGTIALGGTTSNAGYLLNVTAAPI